MQVKQGEVYMIEFDRESIGSEQHGLRPAVVVSNNIGNIHSQTIIVVPITSQIKKMNMPTHVFLPNSEVCIPTDSVVLCENMAHISKERIVRYVCTIPDKYMKQIAIGVTLSTSLISYLDEDELIWLKKVSNKLTNPILNNREEN